MYISSDILVCSITEHFYMLCYFVDPAKRAEMETTIFSTVQNNQLSKYQWYLYSIRTLFVAG